MKMTDNTGAAASAGPPSPAPGDQIVDRSIGEFLREIRQLDDAQVERILVHQRKHHLRFGESAIALKLASSDDVLWALSQQ
ncbi:MAG: tyrosine protein kinase, partial [Rhizobacter sp.]|nr:tyrosine protein kinase [Rhizobacter sp.]